MLYKCVSGCPEVPYVRRHPALPDQKPIFLKIDASSFVEFVKRRVWCFLFAICSYIWFLTIFQTFSHRSRPVVTSKIDKFKNVVPITFKFSPNLSNWCPRRYVKKAAPLFRGVVAGSRPLRLTWSDSFALAERAALLPCKPRSLGLGDGWWGWDSFSVKTNGGILHIIFPSM